MKTVYFIRHLWSKEVGPSEFLKSNGLFGIHYVNEPRSVRPEDYTGRAKPILRTKSILTVLHEMDSEDLICSSFNDEFLEVGPLDKNFGIQLRDYSSDDDSVWVLKVGKHDQEKTKRFYFSEYPMLLAAMPRQGTFGRWHLMRDQILSLYHTGQIEFHYTALAPAQIEALCTSYLYRSGKLVCQSLPSGRTLKDIDIVGLDPDGRRILAQVTFSNKKSDVKEKAEALARYSALSPLLIFFAPASMKEEIQNQEFIPLEEVWEYWEKLSDGIFLNDFFGKNTKPNHAVEPRGLQPLAHG